MNYLGKYSDGHSAYPLALAPQQRPLTRFFGDPLISSMNNLMVRAVTGNAALHQAQVICLSDFHFDDMQVFIRAAIINEVLRARIHKCDSVLFLLEGTQAGHEPDDWSYNKLVGDNSISYSHFAYGWDNMKLHRQGTVCIKELQKQSIAAKEIANQNSIQWHDLQDTMEGLITRITNLSEERNKWLNESILHLHKNAPNSLIFVIGGERHFDNLSPISHIKHCVLRIQEIKKILDFNTALSHVYGSLAGGITGNEVAVVRDVVRK